jgi:WD40 repeat protein
VRFIPLLLFSLLTTVACSQGIYTEFGQNTIGDKKPVYSLSQDKIEILYFKDGENLANLALNKVISYLPALETRLNFNLSNGIKIIVYNHYEDFKNSNINITNPQHYAGGYASISDNSAAVFFDGSRFNFEKQIKQAVAEMLIYESIFGGNMKERIQTATLLTLPDWYYKGMIAYLSESWNIEKDNYLKDFFQNNKQKYFTSLQREDEILAGHSIWRFIEERYGRSAVSNIIYMTRIGRSVENALIYITGMSINSMLENWKDFYLDKYKNDELVFKLPKGQESPSNQISKKKHTQFKFSPDGKFIAIVTNQLGKYEVVLYNTESKTVKKIAKGGHPILNRDINLSYPLIAWQADGKNISVATYDKGLTILNNYNLEGKLIEKIKLNNIPFVIEMCYHPTEPLIAFSVIKDGQSDLMLYNYISKSTQDLSNDFYDDLSPRFSIDGKDLYFISNQYKGQGQESRYYAIYKLNIETKTKKYINGKQQLEINCYEPIPLTNELISYLSDQNGIINNYVLELTNNKEEFQMTNYKRSIIHNDVATEAKLVADLLYFNNKYRIYIGVLSDNYKIDAVEISEKTAYRAGIDSLLKLQINLYVYPSQVDSIKRYPLNQTEKDTGKVQKETKKIFIHGFEEKDDIEVQNTANNTQVMPLYTISRPHFGVNFVMQQLDVSILNNYLFPSNVNERIFNYPMLSPHIQTSICDELNNHVIVAGIRIPVIKTKSSDYYFIYTDRSARIDKELSVFRRGRIIDNFRVPQRIISSQAKYSLKYPFNERARIEMNFLGRNDRVIRQAIDSIELQRNIVNHEYLGNGFEYVFDNVRSNGLNLFEGLRFKIYNENYYKRNGFEFISNNGIDFRWYKKLHRQIYFASRLSGAVSFGTQQTAYYMGGVENWLSNVDSNKNFNYKIPTLRGNDWAFQTIIAPVRGFYRNSRAGNKYLLMNLELRIPLFSYLIQRPISSEFLKSFMVVGFTDIGTAWKGDSPYSIENPFNTQLVQSQQYQVTVVSQRDPFLYGFGLGLRAKVMGHYLKFDHGWGLIENKFQKGLSSFSIGLDF